MTKCLTFDVLIVYNENVASSARTSASVPFNSRNESYNHVYGYFLTSCQNKNLTAAFTTSADIIGPGLCKSFWQYRQGFWVKNTTNCFSTQIFDKFSPTSIKIKQRRSLLFSDPAVKPFNDPDLFNLFFDKQKTYDQLSQYSIPTVSLAPTTLKSIKISCDLLTRMLLKHPSRQDFSNDVIMKDRFGAGGRHVYKFTTNQCQKMYDIAIKNPNIYFILQPYIYSLKPTDFRLVYLRGEVVQSYIRVAKTNEFRCNEHCGGLLTYLPITQITKKILSKSKIIAASLKNNISLYTLDFLVGDSGNPYLLEGNTSPGLDWNLSHKNNEIEAKKLINLVVKELSTRLLN